MNIAKFTSLGEDSAEEVPEGELVHATGDETLTRRPPEQRGLRTPGHECQSVDYIDCRQLQCFSVCLSTFNAIMCTVK